MARHVFRHVFIAGLLIAWASLTSASTEKRSVIAAFQGKKLELNVGTVDELTSEISKQQGLRPDRQVVFFKGKRLSGEDSLAAAGVQDGDQLTVTQARARSAVSDSRVAGSATVDVSGDSDDAVDRGLDSMGGLGSPTPAGAPGMGPGGGMLEQMFGGAQQKEVLEALSDPKKLEASRQALLQHPMFKQMASSVPGLAEAVQSPKKWRETMEQAKSMMDQVSSGGPQAAEVRQAMEAGMKYFQGSGGGPGGPGLGPLGGADPAGLAATTKGVDAAELSTAFGHVCAAYARKMGLSLSDAARGMAAHAMGAEMSMDAEKYAAQMSQLLEKAGLPAAAGLTALPE